jgi:hypothetical protein
MLMDSRWTYIFVAEGKMEEDKRPDTVEEPATVGVHNRLNKK